jgi:excisionase family DNA binding protein
MRSRGGTPGETETFTEAWKKGAQTMAQITYLDPATRVDQAWAHLRDLRRRRFELDQDIVAAETALDIERKREAPVGREPLMTVAQAAERLGVSESKLWKAIRAGSLDVTKVGRNTRVSDMQLSAYMEASR